MKFDLKYHPQSYNSQFSNLSRHDQIRRIQRQVYMLVSFMNSGVASDYRACEGIGEVRPAKSDGNKYHLSTYLVLAGLTDYTGL